MFRILFVLLIISFYDFTSCAMSSRSAASLTSTISRTASTYGDFYYTRQSLKWQKRLGMHRTSGPAGHRILVVLPTARLFLLVLQRTKWSSILLWPTTRSPLPSIFLASIFSAYQQIQNRTKLVAARATVLSFYSGRIVAEIVCRRQENDYNVATKSTSFDLLIRQRTCTQRSSLKRRPTSSSLDVVKSRDGHVITESHQI